MVRNFVLRRRVSGAEKRNFRTYNRWYTYPNENFEYGYPHSNALFNIYSSNAQHFAPNWSFVSNVKQLRQPITSDVTYDVGTPTVYHRIYWHKFLTLPNQMSRYVGKCIRMQDCSRYKWSIPGIVLHLMILFKKWISFFCCSSKYERSGSRVK